MKITVLKLGSSVLRDRGDLPRAVHEIYRHVRRGEHVVAVVSALGDTTERLLESGRVLGADERHVASLLATGEEEATALLALAATQAGVPAVRLDGPGLGIRTEGPRLDAHPVALDDARLRACFAETRLLVVPGFVGVDAGGRTLLGRGGSDLTALFLARRLRAACVLLKDVEGLYERKPAERGPVPRRYARVSFRRALELAGSVLQRKAVAFAAEHGVAFEVGALNGTLRTRVSDGPYELVAPRRIARPLRVALLGCGTVGGGVLTRLRGLPESFEVAAVLVRDPSRHDATVTADAEDAFGARPDVVVELVGGLEPAGSLVARALRAGIDVVTANKALVARRGAELRRLACSTGARLAYSASVGGALPAVELVRAHAPEGIVEVAGVLNGTANFVLGERARGVSVDDAVTRARELGYAEADPRRDLDGRDVADKLAILAREAFGEDAPLCWRGLCGIAHARPGERLVGEARRENGAVSCRVGTRTAFDGVDGAVNALRIRTSPGGEYVVTGTGAGRWPTAEAVLADLLELARDRSDSRIVAKAAGGAA